MLGACASGAPVGPVPLVRSASAGDSARAFEAVRADWDRGSYGERADALRSLQRFVAIYARDPLGPVAKAYIALEALEHDDVDKAKPYLASLALEPMGSTQHLRVAGEARVARLEHRDRDALALTAPLVRQVVEPTARNVMLEEHARAALATQPMREALDAIDMWLSEGQSSDRRRAEALVDALLADQAGDSLARTYASMSVKERRARYSLRLLAIVQDRLEGNELLADLEQSIRSQPRVRGHLLGVLLQTSTDEERRRAVDFLRGVSWGIEHSGAPGMADVGLFVKELNEQRAAVCLARADLESAGVSMVALGPDGNLDSAWKTCAGRAVPVLLGAQTGSLDSSLMAVMNEYRQYFQVALTPLAARGRDIAALGAEAMRALPWEDTTDVARIAAHDRAVEAGLARGLKQPWSLP